ncbi:MAG: BlaI/MecI/CopY family transcriptional regulator [Clostridia bacterium]|nr:BlaI/MecI/CopY family transcriptional regulator [Clostridia bacterium]
MKISNSEMEIMNIIWAKDEEVTSAELADILKDTWKPTTIMTFLKRLCDKGILDARKEGKTNFYSANITEDEYKQSTTESFLREFHNGSVTSLLTALVKGKQPDSKELAEIKKWFNEL